MRRHAYPSISLWLSETPILLRFTYFTKTPILAPKELPKPDQIRRFSSIAGVETPSVCKLIGSHDYIDFSAESLCNGTGIVQRRQFLGCGDGEEGDVLSKVYEERRVLGHLLINIWEFSPGLVPGSCSLYFLVDFKFQSPLYRQDPPVAESVSTEWTDEKHRMYLKSMEASFVDQLYNSLDSLGWRSPKKKSSDITSSRQIHRTPSQFKVLRSGCWQKINFERPDSQLKKTHDPSGFLSSPWIRHYKSSCTPQTLASPSLPGTAGLKNRAVNSSGKNAVPCGSASSSEHFAACQSHSCNQDLVDSNTEVSDQNFTDEEIKSEKLSSKCSSKKMKTSRRDQVVPHSNPPKTGNGPDS